MESSVPEIQSWIHFIRALIWEFIGTMAYIYAFNFSGNDYWGRAITFYAFWVLAVTVSGAHFNPATTLAVYLAEGKYLRQLGRLLLYWLF